VPLLFQKVRLPLAAVVAAPLEEERVVAAHAQARHLRRREREEVERHRRIFRLIVEFRWC
jgi:hypothetical protein